MASNTQIQRIKYFELLLNSVSAAVDNLNNAIAAFEDAKPLADELSEYYGGRQWKKDFADDEAGKLPRDLRRGVLSEDAVYDFLALRDELISKYKGLL